MSNVSAGSWSKRFVTALRPMVSVDLRSLALTRWLLGALLVGDLWARMRAAEVLYSNDGVLSNHYSLFRPLAPFQFSLYVGASSSAEVTVAFLATLVIYLLFMVGYRTRLFHVLSFVCVTSLHSRNLMTELPSDAPLHLWMAWSLFLPLGARFSVDALRRSFASREVTAGELNLRPHGAGLATSFAVLGMVLQLSAMHLFAALRQTGETWQDGTALYYALRQNLWVTDLGAWVGQNVSAAHLRDASHAYRAIEILIAVIVLVPGVRARRASVALLVAFHGISRLFFDLGSYEWVMLGATPMLVGTRDWDAIRARYQARKPALSVYFDATSGLTVAICRLVKRLDVLERMTFVPASSDGPAQAIVVHESASGHTSSGTRALAAIVRSLPFGFFPWLVLQLPGAAWLGDRALAPLVRRRQAIGGWLGMKTFERRRAPSPFAFDDSAARWLGRVFVRSREAAACLFAVVCAIALARDMGDERVPSGLEAVVYRIVAYPRLFQRWGLFAPDPPKRLGTLVAEGETASGAKLDPFTGLPAPSTFAASTTPRPDPLMAAYFTSISQPAHSTYVNELRDYVRRIGDRRGPAERLVRFNVDWIESPVAEPEGPAPSLEGTPIAALSRRITSGP